MTRKVLNTRRNFISLKTSLHLNLFLGPVPSGHLLSPKYIYFFSLQTDLSLDEAVWLDKHSTARASFLTREMLLAAQVPHSFGSLKRACQLADLGTL